VDKFVDVAYYLYNDFDSVVASNHCPSSVVVDFVLDYNDVPLVPVDLMVEFLMGYVELLLLVVLVRSMVALLSLHIIRVAVVESDSGCVLLPVQIVTIHLVS
jgi:hypothetical protein